MGFAYLPHTADLKAAVEGAILEELYAAAVDLVRDIVVGPSPVRPSESLQIPLAAADPEERLFQFVRELVFLYDTEGFIPVEVEVDLDGATVCLRGDHFDADEHHSERQIKALTRHQYRLEEQPGGYRAVLLFDL